MRRGLLFGWTWAAGLVGLGALAVPATAWGPIAFQHRFIADDLPLASVGLTALVDVDRDGRLDFVLGAAQPAPATLYWLRFMGPDRWEKYVIGPHFLSVVGLAPLDVDGDGWVDFVCSGVWYRNPGKNPARSSSSGSCLIRMRPERTTL